MSKYYVVFDCGTQSTKVSIYDLQRNCIVSHSIPTVIRYPRTSYAEMDADHYLQSVRDGIKICIDRSGIDPKKVRSICGDGIICGITGVDEDGQSITPYIPYLDTRCADDAAWIKENLEPIWINESGNSSIDSFHPPVIARWLLKNNEEFKKRGAKFMNNGPYVLSRLAGLKAKDAFIDHATLSGWLVGYHAYDKKWSQAQMDLLGIPMDNLPKIVKPWDIIGHLTEKEAANTGLVAGIPIVAGAGDTMQSMAGCGLVKAGMASDVAGTASMFTVMVDGINEELTKNTDLLFSIGTLPNTYFYWGFIRTGGLSLRWFRDNVMGLVGKEGFYDEMQELAKDIPAGSNGTLFFPYLQGGTAEIRNASGCFLNMRTATNTGELWRAVLESIAYEYLSLIDKMEHYGVNVDTVVITEGGSRSSLWNQIKADVLNKVTYTVKEVEGANLANLAVAAYAVGDIDSIEDSLSKWIEHKEDYSVNTKNSKSYRNMFEFQQELLKNSMQESFSKLCELRGLCDI